MPNKCSDDVLPWNREAKNKLDTKYPYGMFKCVWFCVGDSFLIREFVSTLWLVKVSQTNVPGYVAYYSKVLIPSWKKQTTFRKPCPSLWILSRNSLWRFHCCIVLGDMVKGFILLIVLQLWGISLGISFIAMAGEESLVPLFFLKRLTNGNLEREEDTRRHCGPTNMTGWC